MMSPLTLAQLVAIDPNTGKKAPTYLPWLNATFDEFQINTNARRASFLSQILVESLSLTFTTEIASGAAYDTGQLAKNLGNTPEADGDGQRWKGHGLIQVTGLANHTQCATYFKKPLDEIAAWLQTPEGATRSAGWFWRSHGLNELADAGDQLKVTRRVNGGTNGLDRRLAMYARAQQVLA